jgi:hypothetical protein
MDDFTAGVRELHQRVGDLDNLLRADAIARDLSEKLGDAAAAKAERAQNLMRRVLTVLTVGLLLWTPVVAYGAVWLHEKVRNNCYPVVAFDATPVPRPAEGEPWYCGLFPGTDHVAQHSQENPR